MVGYLTYSGNQLLQDKFDVVTTLWDRIDTSPATENRHLENGNSRNERITMAVDRTGGVLNADRLTYWAAFRRANHGVYDRNGGAELPSSNLLNDVRLGRKRITFPSLRERRDIAAEIRFSFLDRS